MRPDLAPAVAVSQRQELRALVDALVEYLIDDGAKNIEVESTEPAEGELLRVVVKSDKLDQPKVIAVRDE